MVLRTLDLGLYLFVIVTSGLDQDHSLKPVQLWKAVVTLYLHFAQEKTETLVLNNTSRVTWEDKQGTGSLLGVLLYDQKNTGAVNSRGIAQTRRTLVVRS